jgi:Mrp family chromosome partitioning ATPase
VIITVASFKGGVGKTTTAIHLAGYLQGKGPTLLVDGDSNRSAIQWSAGGRLPFTVADEMKAPKLLMSGLISSEKSKLDYLKTALKILLLLLITSETTLVMSLV